MKRAFFIIVAWIIGYINCSAQSKQDLIDFALTVKSKDGIQELQLSRREISDKMIEGYFIITKGTRNLEGELQTGGFNLLDRKIFDLGNDKLYNDENSSDATELDLEAISNKVDMDKIFSFQIIPDVRTLQSDTLSALLKCAFYESRKPKLQSSDLDFGFDISLASKIVKIPFGKEVNIKFVSRAL